MKPYSKFSKGFTLTEVLIAMAILSMTIAIATSLFMDCFNMTFISDKKNKINADIRSVTREMSDIARQANKALIFKSIKLADRDSYEEDRLGDTSTGDALVLYFRGAPSNPQDLSDRPTDRIVIYYRWVENENDDNVGPIKKFDKTISGADRYKSDVALIPSVDEIQKKSKIVVAFSEGLADQKLFYNINNKAFMVNGKIIHGNQAKQISDTYNFTISTRSHEYF